jgi:hypothetical protein
MRVGQQPIQWSGFCLAGLLCVGLAIVKLATERHWSWWRVLLPLWVIMGHNALYILVGLIWLSFVDHGEDEENLTIRPNPPHSYQYAGMLCFLLFVDNLLGRMEVPVLLVFDILSVVCQLLFWSRSVCPSHPSTRRE